jgi:dipeptidyl aminopeptidase/acylaminoacyl peptidase
MRTLKLASSWAAAIAAWSLVTCATEARASEPTPQPVPIPVEEALKTKYIALFTSVASSPDGRYVAYTIADNARADRAPALSHGDTFTATGALLVCYGCDVYVTDQRTGKTLNVSGGVGASNYAAWSPDSRYLAFYSDRDGQMRVWTWEVETQKLRRVSDVLALPSAPLPPLWGDGGRKLLVSLLPEHTTFAESNGRISAQPNPARVLPGSTVAVYSHERTENGPSPETQRVQGYDGFANAAIRDLAQLDVATGESRRLIRSFNGTLRGVSADGRYALATLKSGTSESNYNDSLYDILVLDMTSGQQVMKIEKVPMVWGTTASWAPAGNRFAYTTGARSELMYSPYQETKRRRTGDIFVVEVGGEPINVSTGEHPSFSSGDVPIWSADGDAIYVMGASQIWRADLNTRTARAVTSSKAQRRTLGMAAVRNRSILWQPRGRNKLFARVSNTQTMHEEICSVDIGTGAMSPILAEAQSFGDSYSTGLTFDAPDSKAPGVFAAQSATRAPELFATKNFSETRQLTQLNSSFGNYVMGESRLVTWKGTDGKDYKGTLLLPAGYRQGQRYPMVVWQRPSNVGSMALDTFGLMQSENYQILATRGYAVFYPDFPVSSSREVQRGAEQVLFAGIDRVIELGIADRDRIGLTGTSWGGYSTFVLVTITGRFKVAVAESGPSNHFDSFSVLLRNGAAVRVQEVFNDMGGSPWTARQSYIDSSPFFHLDKVTTPLMIVHAREHGDYSIPQSHASQIFTGLRYLNRTVSMVIYEGGHGFVASAYTDQAEVWNRVIAWYDRFLK